MEKIMSIEKAGVTTGICHLDRLLGGLFIGDNVLWYDEDYYASAIVAAI